MSIGEHPLFLCAGALLTLLEYNSVSIDELYVEHVCGNTIGFIQCIL